MTNALPLLDGAIAAVGDFNGDGKDDVAIVPLGGSGVVIWYSKGDGSFYWGAFVDCGQEIGAMAVGNFDGDGRPDVALGTLFSQQACLLLNSGNGEFTLSFFCVRRFCHRNGHFRPQSRWQARSGNRQLRSEFHLGQCECRVSSATDLMRWPICGPDSQVGHTCDQSRLFCDAINGAY